MSSNHENSVESLKLAAEQGDALSQNALGERYFNGEGVAQDAEEAVKWYRLAAEQGFAEAQFNLGYCYEYGKYCLKGDV